MLHTVVYSVAEAISTDFPSRKITNLFGTSSAESNWVGYPIEENIEGGSHETFEVSGDIFKFSLQIRKLLLGITGELIENYWGIAGESTLFV